MPPYPPTHPPPKNKNDRITCTVVCNISRTKVNVVQTMSDARYFWWLDKMSDRLQHWPDKSQSRPDNVRCPAAILSAEEIDGFGLLGVGCPSTKWSEHTLSLSLGSHFILSAFSLFIACIQADVGLEDSCLAFSQMPQDPGTHLCHISQQCPQFKH